MSVAATCIACCVTCFTRDNVCLQCQTDAYVYSLDQLEFEMEGITDPGPTPPATNAVSVVGARPGTALSRCCDDECVRGGVRCAALCCAVRCGTVCDV